jgi:hypothetical protein
MKFIGNNKFNQCQSPTPLGITIQWWRPDSSFPIPEGYQECDGSQILDLESLFYLEYTPDHRGKHTRGCDFSNQDLTGGVDNLDLIHDHSFSHVHWIAAHRHSATTGVVTDPRDGTGFETIGPHIYHTHDITEYNGPPSFMGNNTEGNSGRTSSVGATGTKHPAFVKLLTLIRIK